MALNDIMEWYTDAGLNEKINDSLSEILSKHGDSRSIRKIGISKERIAACLPELRKAIAFYREYPDLYIDFCMSCLPEEKQKSFSLYTYQRIFLRQAMRNASYQSWKPTLTCRWMHVPTLPKQRRKRRWSPMM